MILIRRHGAPTWHAPTVTAYDNEQAIQRIIEQSPHLLPGAGDGRMVVASEFVVPRAGYVDLVGVSTDGSITLVECKLKANPEIRRSVVGQVLAYAADLWDMSFDEFDRAFSARTGASLVQHIAELTDADFDEELFRANVAANLRSGRFRLVIAVDEITDELKRIVLFLIQHTNTDLQILALELGYVADEGVEILVPTAYGVEARQEKQEQSASGATRWTEASVFSALERACTPEGFKAARNLYEFAKARGVGFNWGAATYATVAARFLVCGKPTSVFDLQVWVGKGGLVINFDYVRWYAPEEQVARLANALRALPTATERFAGLEESAFKRRPSLMIDEALTLPGAVDIIKAAIEELLVNEPSETDG